MEARVIVVAQCFALISKNSFLHQLIRKPLRTFRADAGGETEPASREALANGILPKPLRGGTCARGRGEMPSSPPVRQRVIRRSGNRFADEITRHSKVRARLDAKPASTFAGRALGPVRGSDRLSGWSWTARLPARKGIAHQEMRGPVRLCPRRCATQGSEIADTRDAGAPALAFHRIGDRRPRVLSICRRSDAQQG